GETGGFIDQGGTINVAGGPGGVGRGPGGPNGSNGSNGTFSAFAVPEPPGLVMGGIGLLGVLVSIYAAGRRPAALAGRRHIPTQRRTAPASCSAGGSTRDAGGSCPSRGPVGEGIR